MRRPLVHAGRAAVLCAVLAYPSAAHAQLAPPRLSRSVAPADPRSGAAPASTVELELDIDSDGTVTDVRVTRSSRDEALDAAALDAARRFVFEPATRDGQPIKSRIRYEQAFAERALVEPPPEPPSNPSPPSPPPPPEDEPEPEPEEFVGKARVEGVPREPTKRTLSREEMKSVAGTRGDPLRAVELLPGVSRPAVGGGTPILRGANPFDSQVYLDGAPVPILFHLGGLTSFVHSRVLDVVELYPSNFSVRYGRKVGGVVEAKVRDPRTDGFHAIGEASLLDTSLLVEAPIGKNFSFLAAARRSNIDAFLGLAGDIDDLELTAAPVYWDYQGIAEWRPTESDRVRLLAYGSSDRLAVVLAKPNDVEPAVRGAFEARDVFHRVQAGWRHRFGGGGSEQNTELTYGRYDGGGVFAGLGRADWAIDTVQVRSEWTGVVSPAFRVTGGLDVLGNRLAGSYTGVPVPPDEGDQVVGASRQGRVSIDANTWVLLPGAYLELGIRPIAELLLTPGVRADYNDAIGRGVVDPRFSARLDVTERSAVKAGIGRFSQSPDERMVADGIGNPNLRMTHSLHASAGVEQKLGDDVVASIEGFGKRIDGIVTITPDGRAPYFANSQDGRIVGGELMLRLRPSARFFGFLSYTLMRSERRDENGTWRLFDRDQPHIVNATGTYRLGRGWEVGASLRYTTGTPYTPVASATYDANTDTYAARLGRPMSARNPAFSRVDLRVQKTWTFTSWSLVAYLDVQNVLNSPNREGFAYSYDYRSRDGVRGLPILPILGLRGEL